MRSAPLPQQKLTQGAESPPAVLEIIKLQVCAAYLWITNLFLSVVNYTWMLTVAKDVAQGSTDMVICDSFLKEEKSECNVKNA